jgi:hypothetical protein
MDENFGLGRPHVSSGEPRALFEFKHKVDEKRRSLSNLEIFILIG